MAAAGAGPSLVSALPTRARGLRRHVVPLHATICRYDGVTASIEEVMQAGRRLAFALSTALGFVSYAVLDAGDGVLVSVTVFDDQADLAAAQPLIDSSITKQLTAVLPRPPQVIAGEVIVQRGM